MTGETMTGMQALERPPMYWEARRQCEEFNIFDPVALEQTRLSMCHREWWERMRPWHAKLAKLHPVMYSRELNPPIPPEYARAQEAVREMERIEAERLGISQQPLEQVVQEALALRIP